MTSITSSSGPLDVQGLVSQLMTVAQQPLTQMQAQASTYNNQISDYGTLSSDLTSLQSSLSSLSSGQFINTYQATSSNTDVLTATTSSSAQAGVYNVTVGNLATAQNLAYAGQASQTASLGNTADTMKFSFASGSTSTVNIPANATLAQISNAVNAAGIGISASVVKADNSASPYRLVLTGTTVGAGNSFSTSTTSGQSALSFLGFDASTAVNSSGTITDSRLTAQAQDANLTVNGLAMVEGSNNVTDAINGVSMTLSQAGTSSLTVAPDTGSIQTDVQGFVSAFNKLQGDITSLSSTSGGLQGDYTLVNLQDQLDGILNTPISGANGTSTVAYLAQVGVSLQKDGTLALDATNLTNAISANPTAVANVFGNSNNDGFAQRFNSQINNMLGPNGLVTTRTSSLNTEVTSVKAQEAREQTRLDTLQESYLTLYSSLNSSLAAMEQTSTSMTAMLASSTA
jgi:flagellar hook-associated protein 2